MSIQPIVPNLLDAQRALENKYTTGSVSDPTSLLASLNALPPPAALPNPLRPASLTNTIAPLFQYDLARSNRGLAPLSPRQTAAALQTLRTGQPATKPRRQGFLSSALSDLRSLVGAIPKLPMLAVNEVQQLPQVPADLAAAVGRASNPLQAVGNAAAVPGLRMIPGSFVANQLFGDQQSGSQGTAGLLAHPLFTALDLLPAAEGAAKLAPVTKAARAETEAANLARVEQAVELTGHGGNARLAPRPRALQTVLTRKLDEAGNVIPNRVGSVLGDVADTFYSTPTGRAFQATFKERDVPRMESRYTSTLRQAADPTAPVPTAFGKVNVAGEAALAEQARRIAAHMEEAGIDAERSAALFDIADNPRAHGLTIPEEAPGLTPAERGIFTEIREFQQQRARLTEGDLTQTLSISGRPEVYDLPTARKVGAVQRATELNRRFVEAREAITNPSVMGADPVAQRDAILAKIDEVNASGLPDHQRSLLVRSWSQALDEAGWVRTVDDAGRETLQQVARPTIDDLTIALRPLSRRYPTIPRLIDHLRSGRWSAARRDLSAFAETRAGGTLVDDLPFDIDDLKDELSRLIARDRTLERTARYTPRRLARAERIQARVEQQAVPARFASTVQSIADEKIRARVGEIYTTTPDLDRAVAMANDRVYGPLALLPEAEVRALQREARASWQVLRDEGTDPIFFSRVTPQQRARIPHVRVSDTPVTPAAARARMWDATPYQRDMGVALTRDALDLLQRRATDAFLDEFQTTYGKTRAQLEADLYDRAVARAEHSPNISVQTHLANLIDQRWAPFDASKFGSSRTSPALSIAGRESTYVPRVMSENMERLFKPPLPKLTAAFDPVMKVFRTAVLPLAPRWHIYNTIGGATMTAVSDPAAFRYLPEIIHDMWNVRRETGHARAPHIEGQPPAGFGTVPPEVRSWDAEVKATSPIKDRLAAAHNYAAGRTMARWFGEARDSRLAKITDAGRRAVEASYNANQLVDDMYRGAVGTSARRRALARGATEAMADAESVAAIRRVFQSWDEMTPMERSIMRAVVPFYGWTAHILKFAMKYPFDHPFRVSVLGSFARAEMSDALTGLPEYIRDMVLIGDKRANGTVRALNVGPFNPFRDLPSNFTVAGFLGNLNPILTGTLESVGINTQQGGPSLYPEVRYDPETGRLVADPKGNLASNIIGNVLPQAELFTALIGRNESFNAQLSRDPEAAGRTLLSNLGVPVLFRDVNVGEELIRSELARIEDQDTARREALSTGNLGILDDFPSMGAYAEQIRELESRGLLDQLRPEEGQPGAPSGAGIAYAAQLAALGG